MNSTSPFPRLLLPAFSMFFERMAFYGLRGVIIVFLLKHRPGEEMEVINLYGTLSYAFAFVPLLGALTGIASARVSILVGGLMEAFGLFLLAFFGYSMWGAGICIFIIGSGLVRPNVLAYTAGIFQNRKEGLDSAMAILYGAVNLGVLVTTAVVLEKIPEENFSLKFFFCGVAALISGGVFLVDFFLKPVKPEEGNANSYLAPSSILWLVSALVCAVGFWALFGLHNGLLMQAGIDLSSYYRLDAYLVVFFCIATGILWAFVRFFSSFKIALGIFILGVLSALMAFAVNSGGAVSVGFGFTIVIALAEVLVAPIILSVIGQTVSPRFTGFFFAIYFVITTLVSSRAEALLDMSDNHVDAAPKFLLLGLVSVVFAALVFGIGYVIKGNLKKKSPL